VRNYQIYLIEEEFAAHYFGRERMFFQLFQEFEYSVGEIKSILSKQIHYITRPIPNLRLNQFIHQQLQTKKDFRSENSAYYIEQGIRSTAKLELFDRHLILQATGSYDAETVFFEVLRKSEEAFLAIDLYNERFGWLKPIKERKFV
jgi:hypothetical protein